MAYTICYKDIKINHIVFNLFRISVEYNYFYVYFQYMLDVK
jgi:hypothetical protein